MAQDISIASVYIDDHQAGQKLKELAIQADKLALKMNKLRKANDKAGYDKARKDWRAAAKEVTNYKRTIVDVTQVMNNLSGTSQKNLIKSQKILRNEVSRLNRSTKEEIALYNTKVAQLRKVDAELIKVRMDMRALNTTQQSWLSRSANAFNKYTMMAGSLVATLYGMIFAFKAAIKQADEFEIALDGLSALTGIEGTELQYFSDEAKKLSVSIQESGVRITQSAADILNAYKRMGSARPELIYNKEALAEVTKNAIILSEAAKMDVIPATNALAVSLNQFNASAKDSPRYMNAIAAGSKYGAGNIEYIAAALEKAGTSANMAGIEIEEAVAIVETIAPKFAQPSMAGTQLRNIFIRLQTGADAFNPKIVGMKTALDNLAEANLTTSEKVKIFGLRNINAAETLIVYRDKMAHFKDILTDTNIATEQAIINTSNHASIIMQAKNKLNLVAIELGEHLAPSMTFSTNAATYLIKATLSMMKTIHKYRVYIISATAAIIAYNLVVNASSIKLRLYTIATNLATKATKLFNLAMKTSPLGMLVGVLAAAATAFFLLRDEIFGAKNAQKEFNDEVERGKVLLDDNKGLEDRSKLVNKMSATSLERFKEDVQTQLKVIDEMNEAKLLAQQKYIKETQKWQDWIDLTEEGSSARHYAVQNESMKIHMEKAKRHWVLLTQQVQDANADQLQSYIKLADDRLKLVDKDTFVDVPLPGADAAGVKKSKFDPRKLGDSEIAHIISLGKQKRAALQDQRNLDIIDLHASFNEQENLRQVVHNKELVELGNNQSERERLEEEFRRGQIQRQIAFLETVAQKTRDIISSGGIEGMSLEEAMLSDEERDSLLAKLEELKLKISELHVQLIPDDASTTNTDVLGMSQEDWDLFQLNMQAAFEAAGHIHDIWANFNQAKTNQEAEDFERYQDNVEKKISLLEKQKDRGIISEEEYTDKVEKLDAQVDKKRRKLEHDAAVRERETAVFSILLNTAMGIMAVWSEWAAVPPVAGVLTALVSALGLAQVAALPPVPQYAQGNYLNVIGRDDGRSYNAKVVDGHASGFFSDPTYIKDFGLVGDTPKKELVFNPVDTQKILDTPYLLSAIKETLAVPQFASGNSDAYLNASSQSQLHSDPLLLQALARLNANLESPLIATLLANEEYVRVHQDAVREIETLHAEIDQ